MFKSQQDHVMEIEKHVEQKSDNLILYLEHVMWRS